MVLLDNALTNAHNQRMTNALRFLLLLIIPATFACSRTAEGPEGDYCANPPIPVICEDDMPCSMIPDAIEEGTCRILPPANTDPNP